jgi:hypothetical protein
MLFAATAVLLASHALADIISETEDPYCEGICLPVFGFDVSRDQSVGIRITPNGAYALDSVAVWLFDNDNSSIDFITMTIRDGGDSVPGGTILETITFAAPPTQAFQPVLFTVNSTTHPLLAANRPFWVVLESPAFGGESSVWAVASPGNGFSSTTNLGRWQPGGLGAFPAHTIRGTRSTPRCVADFDDGSGSGTPDGGVTLDDLLYYLDLYAAGDVRADLDDGSFTGTRDGGVTLDDLLYFLAHYEVGC